MDGMSVFFTTLGGAWYCVETEIDATMKFAHHGHGDQATVSHPTLLPVTLSIMALQTSGQWFGKFILLYSLGIWLISTRW